MEYADYILNYETGGVHRARRFWPGSLNAEARVICRRAIMAGDRAAMRRVREISRLDLRLAVEAERGIVTMLAWPGGSLICTCLLLRGPDEEMADALDELAAQARGGEPPRGDDTPWRETITDYPCVVTLPYPTPDPERHSTAGSLSRCLLAAWLSGDDS